MEEKNSKFQENSDINELNVNIDKQNKKKMAFNFVLIAIIFIDRNVGCTSPRWVSDKWKN